MNVPIRRCEKNIAEGKGKKKKGCPYPPVAYVMGQWRCAGHLPPVQPKCSHSLAPSGRCAFCGQKVS